MTNAINPFGDLSKIVEKFKVPGFDMAPIIESRRKDMEALVEANKTTYEAMQALAQKQTEILTHAMQAIQDSAKGLSGGGADALGKQTRLAQEAYQKALADMKDLAESARKSQVDVTTGLTQRATKSLDEAKKLMQPS